MKKYILLLAVCCFMCGCASQSGNVMLGTAAYGYSLAEQREALRSVVISQGLPDGAILIGQIDAARCYRNTLDAEPTEEAILTDLRMFAYAKGADGIYDVNIFKETGLLKNCWYILNGKAAMYRNGK